MGGIATRLTVWLLKHGKLSDENRNLLTVQILDKLGALPFRDILTTNELGETLVNDVPLDVERARLLREGARAALNNSALQTIWQSIAFKAVNYGFHQAETERQILWGRAGLWFSQQMQEMLRDFAGRDA